MGGTGTGKKGLFACLCLLLLLGVVLGDDDPPAEGDPAADGGKEGDAAPADKDKDKDKGPAAPVSLGHATKCYYTEFGKAEAKQTCDATDTLCMTYWDTEGQEHRGCTSDNTVLKNWGRVVEAYSIVCQEVTGRYEIVDRFVCICTTDLCNNDKFGHSEYDDFLRGPNTGAEILESGARKTLAMTLAMTLTFAAAILAY